MRIWGISALSHDAAVAVIEDGEILFAAQAERYSGRKNDPDLNHAILYDAIQYGDPDLIVWFERPWVKLTRHLYAGQGWVYDDVKQYMRNFGINAPIEFVGHHQSHAAGGYYTSGFQEAAVLVIDAIGEWDTATIWEGTGEKLRKVKTVGRYPHSLGLWYSAMTQRVGLKPNEEEYILMGMAAYGKRREFYQDVRDMFVEDHYPPKLHRNLHKGWKHWYSHLDPLTDQERFDLARSVQEVYEEKFMELLHDAKRWVPSQNLVLSGGCALNCVANNHAFRLFRNVWIMPNPGDAGSSLGAAAAYYGSPLKWRGPYLGHKIHGEYPVDNILAELLTKGVVGVANGRAEFGPRALGNRSLLADPRKKNIRDTVNIIKQRQMFRPFAPAILEEEANKYFRMPKAQNGTVTKSPYMQFVARCEEPLRYPGIVHVDNTSRVQTVGPMDHPGFYELLRRWQVITDCPMLLNTSLNVRGKPLVNDSRDAKEFANTYNVPVF